MTVRSKYKDAPAFLTKYHPDNAFKMISDNGVSGMFEADVPTLTILKYAFGQETVKAFTNNFLRDAIRFNGMYDKVDPSVIASVSESIQTEYYYLKASELVLFFHWLKSGHFRDRNDDDRGKMYGTFNGEVIMDCLWKFKQEREKHLDEADAKKKIVRHDEMMKNAVPPPPGFLDRIKGVLSSVGHPEQKSHKTKEDTERTKRNMERFDALLKKEMGK